MENPKTLLLVDDDSDDLDFFCEAVSLIDRNIICIPAIDSEATLQSLQNNDIILPDLIFLDLNMPRVDGRKFLLELKKLPPYAQIPVIMYSTSSFVGDIEETKQLGASLFLTKPNSLKELTESLTHIFSSELMFVPLQHSR